MMRRRRSVSCLIFPTPAMLSPLPQWMVEWALSLSPVGDTGPSAVEEERAIGFDEEMGGDDGKGRSPTPEDVLASCPGRWNGLFSATSTEAGLVVLEDLMGHLGPRKRLVSMA